MEKIKLKELPPILELDYPKISLQKGEGLKRASVAAIQKFKTLPKFCESRSTIEMRRLHQRSALYEADKELKTVKAAARMKRISCDNQWDILEKDMEDFKESFKTYNQLIIENGEKKLRAHKKISEDRRIIEVKELEINDLEGKMLEIRQVCKDVDILIRKHKIYEDFLYKVCAAFPDKYNKPEDIKNHYQSLMSSKHMASERSLKDLDNLEGCKKEYSQMIEEKASILQGIKEKNVKLHLRYEKAQATTRVWESVLASIKEHLQRREGGVESLKLGVWNLYREMCRMSEHPIEADQDNLEQHLKFIRKSMLGLNTTVAVAEKHQAYSLY